MTLKEARAWMLSNPGKKITCQYFHDEWIMFDGSRFVFEDGVEPDSCGGQMLTSLNVNGTK